MEDNKTKPGFSLGKVKEEAHIIVFSFKIYLTTKRVFKLYFSKRYQGDGCQTFIRGCPDVIWCPMLSENSGLCGTWLTPSGIYKPGLLELFGSGDPLQRRGIFRDSC